MHICLIRQDGMPSGTGATDALGWRAMDRKSHPKDLCAVRGDAKER